MLLKRLPREAWKDLFVLLMLLRREVEMRGATEVGSVFPVGSSDSGALLAALLDRLPPLREKEREIRLRIEPVVDFSSSASAVSGSVCV